MYINIKLTKTCNTSYTLYNKYLPTVITIIPRIKKPFFYSFEYGYLFILAFVKLRGDLCEIFIFKSIFTVRIILYSK